MGAQACLAGPYAIDNFNDLLKDIAESKHPTETANLSSDPASLYKLLKRPANTARDLTVKALNLCKLGDTEGALASLDRALKLKPDFTAAIGTRALLHLETSNPEAAEADIKRLLQLSSSSANAKKDKAAALLLRFRAHYAIGRKQQAARDLKAAAENDPENPKILAAQLDLKIARDDFQGVLRDVNKALAKFPGNCDLLVRRGRALANLNRYSEAKADLQRVLGKAPSVRAYCNYFFTLNRQEKYGTALTVLNEGVSRYPNSHALISKRAYLLNQLGRYDKGVTEATSAIKLDPSCPQDYRGRGIAYYKLKRYPEAIADFTESIELGDESATNYVNRAACLNETNKFADAISDCNKALSMVPNHVGALNSRGLTYFWMGEHKKAIADLELALASDPDFYAAMCNLAHVHLESGDNQLALRIINRGLAKDDRNADFLLQRSRIYQRMHNYPYALKDIDRAIEINPRSSKNLIQRAEIYINSGRYEAAVSDLNKALALIPSLVRPYALRGQAFARLGQMEQALADIEFAQRFTRTSASKRSEMQPFDIRETKEMIRTLDSLVAIMPNQPDIYYNRGILHFIANNNSACVNDMQKFLRGSDTSGGSAGNAAAIASLALRKTGKGGAARELLTWAQQHIQAGSQDSIMMSYLQGDISVEHLLKGVKKKSQLTRLKTFAGIDLAIKHESNAARTYLRWVAENGDASTEEHALAVSELTHLTRK